MALRRPLVGLYASTSSGVGGMAPAATTLVQEGVPLPLALLITQASGQFPPPQPRTIMRLRDSSRAARANARANGAPTAPSAINVVHCGVPPSPFALASTETAFVGAPVPCAEPPKTVRRFEAESYVAAAP